MVDLIEDGPCFPGQPRRQRRPQQMSSPLRRLLELQPDSADVFMPSGGLAVPCCLHLVILYHVSGLHDVAHPEDPLHDLQLSLPMLAQNHARGQLSALFPLYAKVSLWQKGSLGIEPVAAVCNHSNQRRPNEKHHNSGRNGTQFPKCNE